ADWESPAAAVHRALREAAAAGVGAPRWAARAAPETATVPVRARAGAAGPAPVAAEALAVASRVRAPAGPRPARKAQLEPAAPARSDRLPRRDPSTAGAALHLERATMPWPPRSPRSGTWPGPGRRFRAAGWRPSAERPGPSAPGAGPGAAPGRQ